jgi:hypothetical protein
MNTMTAPDYTGPTMDLPAALPAPYALFDVRAICLASLFGTPLAGGLLMAHNYRRLRAPGKAFAVVLITGILALVLFVLGVAIPALSWKISLLLSYAMRLAAPRLQGDILKQHVAAGGSLGSGGKAVGLGLALALLVFGGAYAVAAAQKQPGLGPSVKVGQHDDVYYTGSATREQAETLGKALKEDGFFTDAGADVTLNKTAEATTLSFIVKDGVWDDAETVKGFEILTQQIAPLVGGLPVKLQLLNRDREKMTESNIGSVTLGKDEVFYFGSVTQEDARKLTKALTDEGYLQGRGADVFLARHKQGTGVWFVVSDGIWDKPQDVTNFVTIVKSIAPSVGGLPITLRLLNTSLVTKKEVAVAN